MNKSFFQRRITQLSYTILLLALLAINLGSTQVAQAAIGDTARISIASDGTEGNSHSFFSSISADGRYVAFQSNASNLVPGDTNGMWDIFVYDRKTGVTSRVSVASDGTEANGNSDIPSISADGRYIAFSSGATNLDPNQLPGVFVRDRKTSTTTLISRYSTNPAISGDGRYVVFESAASDLVSGDMNGKVDVFVRDRRMNSTARISVATDGTEGDGDSREWGWGLTPAISADGRYIAFSSDATNLVSGDTNGLSDIFVRDTQENMTVRVSVASDGTELFSSSYGPSISANGRYVAFGSDFSGILVHDLRTSTTTLISVAPDGSPGDGGYTASIASISANGRYVAFISASSNLVSNDTNSRADVFIRDLWSNVTSLVSVASDGRQGNDDSSNPILWVRPSLSSNGRYVSFASLATNLVDGDTNGMEDIFVHENAVGGKPH